MKLKIIHKRYADWDEKTRAKIDKLRFRDYGSFKTWQTYYSDKLDTFIAFHRNEPVGSCMIYASNHGYLSGFYVMYKMRRKGVGGALMRRCAKHYSKFKVFPNNNHTEKFFGSFKSRKMI